MTSVARPEASTTASPERIVRKKTVETEILREAVDVAVEKKVDCALALVRQGGPLKTVCTVLGLARSNLNILRRTVLAGTKRVI